MGFSRQEYWSDLPFPSPVDHILTALSTMTRPSWVAPQAWLSFIELDKAVVLVWLDWLVFCEYGFSVSALWCPLATPTILLGFLLPWTWGVSSQLLQQSSAAAPYLGWGVSPHHHPFWSWTWNSSSRSSCACAAATPWRWVGPPRRRPWPQPWDSSSRPFLHHRSLALSSAVPDLGHGVTPLGRLLSGMGSSQLLPLTSDVGQPPTLNARVAAARACNRLSKTNLVHMPVLVAYGGYLELIEKSII